MSFDEIFKRTSVHFISLSAYLSHFPALPLTAFGTDKFGCRPLVMFGGFALFLGYLLSSLATGIGVVMLAQGVIGGNTHLYLKNDFI